jgi:hypothetical protein
MELSMSDPFKRYLDDFDRKDAQSKSETGRNRLEPFETD